MNITARIKKLERTIPPLEQGGLVVRYPGGVFIIKDDGDLTKIFTSEEINEIRRILHKGLNKTGELTPGLLTPEECLAFLKLIEKHETAMKRAA